MINIILTFFRFKKSNLFLLYFDVNKYILLFFSKLKIFKFLFIFKLISIIIISGEYFFKPSILQLSNELSLLIDLEVEIILSYLDLIK